MGSAEEIKVADSCQLDREFFRKSETLNVAQHIQTQWMSRASVFSVSSRESFGFNVLPIQNFIVVSFGGWFNSKKRIKTSNGNNL